MRYRSSLPGVFLGEGLLKICSKSSGEHPYRSAISIKLLCNFIEITLRHRCSPVNLMHIFRTPFLKNTSGGLLLVLLLQKLISVREMFETIFFQVLRVASYQNYLLWPILFVFFCFCRHKSMGR